MHHGVRPGLLDDLAEPRRIVNVADFKPRAGQRDGGSMPRDQIVVDHHVGAERAQRLDRVAADVAGSPGDDNGAHGRPIEK